MMRSVELSGSLQASVDDITGVVVGILRELLEGVDLDLSTPLMEMGGLAFDRRQP